MTGERSALLAARLREEAGTFGTTPAHVRTLMREAADALDAYNRSIVAHHAMHNLSDDVIRESIGGPCQVCARAQEQARGPVH